MSVFDIFLVLRKVIILSRQKVRQQKNTAATSIIDCFVKNKDKNSGVYGATFPSSAAGLLPYLRGNHKLSRNKLMYPFFFTTTTTLL